MTAPRIDYTSRDWDAILLSLRTHLQVKFPNTWRDFYESQMGMAWLELVAYSYDILGFYLDVQANNCLTGDTEISLVNGTEVAIEDLVGLEPFYVYSYDHESSKIVPALATAQVTRKNAELVEVELDNGEKVRCTPDHRWMLRDGSYREARELKSGDSLMPLYRRYDAKHLVGYEMLMQPSPRGGRFHFTHRQFASPDRIPRGLTVHHANFTKQDNCPDNLIIMTLVEHSRLHCMTPEKKEKVREGIRQANARRGHGPHAGCVMSEESKRAISLKLTGRRFSDEHRKKISAALKGRKKSATHQANLSKSLRGKTRSDDVKQRTSATLLEHYRTHPETRERISAGVRAANQRKEDASVIAEIHFNHKVVAVRTLTVREDCCDLSVEKYHNFALTAGVFVHNCYLDTARDRDAVVNICKLVGYKLRSATSAAVTCTATIAAVQVVDVIIAAGTVVTTVTGVVFRTLTEQRIPAGSLTADIVFSEGEVHSDSFVSAGAVFQSFQLADPEVIDGTTTVLVAGAEWTEVASLVFSSDTSTEYTVTQDADNFASVEFGDNSNGLVPPVGSTIDVTYRVGGGVRGNIALSEIGEDITGQLDAAPPVAITVGIANDVTRGSGGEDRETIDHAKFWAPRWVSTNGRAVTEYDYDTLATMFSDPTYGAAAFAKANLRQEIPELNTVDLYVWSRDFSGSIAAPSTGLLDALEAYFMNNGAGAVRVICVDCETLAGNVVYTDVAVTITVADTYAVATVQADVETALDALFTSADIRPGEAFRISRVYNTVQSVTGVEHALVDRLTASYLTTDTEATGDGVTTSFSLSLELNPNLPVVPLTVTVTAAAQVAQDNGDGDMLIGAVNAGTIDYDTGVINITFPTAPGNGVDIDVAYRHILDYQRGELEQTTDAAHLAGGLITGQVAYPPAVAYDTVTGEKGIAFTDGFQTVRDSLGDGVLYDADSIVRGTIDYDTGGYSFVFASPPAIGSSIRSAYRQMLRTPSEDVPIDNTQLATKGLYAITVE